MFSKTLRHFPMLTLFVDLIIAINKPRGILKKALQLFVYTTSKWGVSWPSTNRRWSSDIPFPINIKCLQFRMVYGSKDLFCSFLRFLFFSWGTRVGILSRIQIYWTVNPFRQNYVVSPKIPKKGCLHFS